MLILTHVNCQDWLGILNSDWWIIAQEKKTTDATGYFGLPWSGVSINMQSFL